MSLNQSDIINIHNQASSAIMITDLNGVIVHANDKFCETTGYAMEEIIGKNPSILQSQKTHPGIYKDMWNTISKGKTWSGRILNKRKPKLPIRIAGGDPAKNTSEYWAQLTITPIRNESGKVYLYSASHLDISREIEIEHILEFDRIGSKTSALIAQVLQQTTPLAVRLESTLSLLAEVEEIKIENKCGIFVVNEEQTHLEMLSLHGSFTEEFIEREQRIPFGQCLCGRVAQSGEVLISDDCFCDDQHENMFVGMTAHGHYIVPLKIYDETIGVMFLYTDIYPSRDMCRIEMLTNIGHLIALAIRNDKVEQKLIAASEISLIASQTKSDFLANMSHEIRTPLNGILGFTDMLLQEDERTTDENRKEWLSVIQNSGQHLLHLINNILDLSKVESAEIELEMSACDPVNELADLASIMRVHANDKMIDLEIKASGHLPHRITTDPTRFRQILTNLISNAIKFTETGSVTIHTELVDSGDHEMSLVVQIIDTGTGIPENKLKTIFEPFTQADSSVTRIFGGTGLGLTISRQLAIVLGGTLEVESTLGEGSTFTLSLPIGALDQLDLRLDFQSESVRNAQLTREHAPLKDLINGRILLVDDGKTNRQLIGLILERAGAKVVTANNGQEGYNLAIESEFDLILMDMQMPIMDGYTATNRLREQGIKTPIIALTASAMVNDRERSMDAGCNEYMTKPVDIKELVDRAAYWIINPQAEQVATPKPLRIIPEHAESPTRALKPREQSDVQPPAIISSLLEEDPDLREIVLGYIKQLPDYLSKIEQAYANKDLEIISAVAHKLRGSGGTVGLDPLTQAAIKLEDSVLDQQLDKTSQSIEDLRTVIDQIQRGGQQLPTNGSTAYES